MLGPGVIKFYFFFVFVRAAEGGEARNARVKL
jgi:hypothetical protein